jgi:hypothetical protein
MNGRPVNFPSRKIFPRSAAEYPASGSGGPAADQPVHRRRARQARGQPRRSDNSRLPVSRTGRSRDIKVLLIAVLAGALAAIIVAAVLAHALQIAA